MEIGILGGTFNPIHNGHLAIAEYIREKFGLKKVLFIPCNIPYHKKTFGLALPRHRLNMVRLAIKNNNHFKAMNIEIRRGGLTYSIDTIKYLKKIYPVNTKFYFILGEDSLPELPLWLEIKSIARLCRFIAVNRPGAKRLKLKPYLASRISYVKIPSIDISSTQIRHRLKKKQSVKYLVPDSVANYIKKYRLYQK